MLRFLAFFGFLIETTLLLVLKFGDLRQHLVGAVVLQILPSVFYLIGVFLILKNPQESVRPRHLTGLIAAAAILFRITVWPLFPAFSEDVFRYRWEGKLQSSGGNPYQARPNDPAWVALQDTTFSRVVAPDVKAGYGPLTELIEWGTYQAVSRLCPDELRQVFWFKAPAALFDLGLLAAIYYLLKARGLGPERLLIYAWCPLPIFEFWATGHNDATMLFFLTSAVALAASSRWNWAALALGLAAAAKLWPLVLLPLFVPDWRPAKGLRTVSLACGGFAVCALPYLSNVKENLDFTSGFLGGWRNNDFLFGFVLAAFQDPRNAKYATFAILAAAVILVTLWRPPIENGILAITTIMLAISANIHPWYLTWILPFLAVSPVLPLLLWTALMPLTYAVLIDWYALRIWNGVTSWRWYVYLPVSAYSIWFIGRRLRRRPDAGPPRPVAACRLEGSQRASKS